MENIAMNQMSWQSAALSALACATSALRPLTAQGIAVRPAAVDGRFVPFAVAGAADVVRAEVIFVTTDATAVKRDRAITGNGRLGYATAVAAHVPGPSAWSPPI